MTNNKNHSAVKFWAKIPHGIWIREATSVAVDSKDNVYVFNRGNIPLLVFNSSGDLINNWGNEDPFGDIEVLQLNPNWKHHILTHLLLLQLEVLA